MNLNRARQPAPHPDCPPDKADLLGLLRQATRQAHHELEQQALLQPLQSEALTRDDYIRVLAAFAGFYRALEPALTDAMDMLPIGRGSYRYLPRLALLQSDLDDLAAPQPGTIPLLSERPAWPTQDALLGALYVLEGATQGGRVIAPRLAQVLKLGPDRGARYFHLYEQKQWRYFKAMLENCAGGADPLVVAASAVQTFTALHRHLDRCAGLSARSGT